MKEHPVAGNGVSFPLKLAALVILAALSMAGRASAKDLDPIDAGLEECLKFGDDDDNKRECLGIAYTKWEEAMDKAYADLMLVLPYEAGRKALEKARQDWIAYKDSQVGFFGATFDRPTPDELILDLYRQRTLQLKEYAQKIQGGDASGQQAKNGAPGREGAKVSFADAYYQKGLVYEKQSKHQAAWGTFDRAIALDPNKPEYYLARENAGGDIQPMAKP